MIKYPLAFVKIILAILFLLCLLDWSYSYFQLVRFLGMVGFAYLAYNDFNKNKTWSYVWIASAILINPLIKIALGRNIWNVVDVIWSLLLIISMLKKRSNV
jgi:Family of unknown function (DUF6804)